MRRQSADSDFAAARAQAAGLNPAQRGAWCGSGRALDGSRLAVAGTTLVVHPNCMKETGMATTTEEKLAEIGRRIDRLSAGAGDAATEARPYIDRHVDTLLQEVDETLGRLGNELDMAEHRLSAELAHDREKFIGAVEAELCDWDAYLQRMRASSSADSLAARRNGGAVADLQRRRDAVAASLAGVAAATGKSWRDAKRRVDAALDELKRRADAAGRE
jgi:hypothetical protein